MRNILVLLFIAVALMGCRNLDPAGPYRADSKLYAQDVGIRAAYDTVHTFVLWEYQNRKALANKPEIRKSADYMRVNMPKWMASVVALRDAYAAVPNDANLASLQRALLIIKEAMIEASNYMVSATQ